MSSEAPHTKSSGYAASLHQQAKWIDEAASPLATPQDRIGIDDIDTDELRDAAAHINELEAALKNIRARALFELEHPTEMRDTALSLIEREANKALGS